jgi:hypothetical protein
MSRASAGAILALGLVAAQPSTEWPVFEAVQPELFGAGANLVNAFADYDGDGDPDLFVGFNGAPNRLYRNDKGRFTDVAVAAGVADARPTRAAAWGDADADGDVDLLVGFAPGAGPVLRFYRNDNGRFGDRTADAGLTVEAGAVRQPSWVDADGDGDLDLFVAFRDRPNAFFPRRAISLFASPCRTGTMSTSRSRGRPQAGARPPGIDTSRRGIRPSPSGGSYLPADGAVPGVVGRPICHSMKA